MERRRTTFRADQLEHRPRPRPACPGSGLSTERRIPHRQRSGSHLGFHRPMAPWAGARLRSSHRARLRQRPAPERRLVSGPGDQSGRVGARRCRPPAPARPAAVPGRNRSPGGGRPTRSRLSRIRCGYRRGGRTIAVAPARSRPGSDRHLADAPAEVATPPDGHPQPAREADRPRRDRRGLRRSGPPDPHRRPASRTDAGRARAPSR